MSGTEIQSLEELQASKQNYEEKLKLIDNSLKTQDRSELVAIRSQVIEMLAILNEKIHERMESKHNSEKKSIENSSEISGSSTSSASIRSSDPKDVHTQAVSNGSSSVGRLGENIDWCVGDFCEALYEADGLFYPAVISRVDDFQQDVSVVFIGYGNSATVELSNVRLPTNNWYLTDAMDELSMKVGAKCQAMNPKDGSLYEAVIQRLDGDFVHIKFTKFGTYDRVRKTNIKKAQRIVATEDNPLKILPSDDKRTVSNKKRQIRQLEKDKKQKQEEKEMNKSVQSWKQFQKAVQTHSVPNTGVTSLDKESIFRTSDGTNRTTGSSPMEFTVTKTEKKQKFY